MAFAGVWEIWQLSGGKTIETFCIITADANEWMAPIHNRMPVILDEGQWKTWLPETAENRPTGSYEIRTSS